jgi:hypothetical protein
MATAGIICGDIPRVPDAWFGREALPLTETGLFLLRQGPPPIVGSGPGTSFGSE